MQVFCGFAAAGLTPSSQHHALLEEVTPHAVGGSSVCAGTAVAEQVL